MNLAPVFPATTDRRTAARQAGSLRAGTECAARAVRWCRAAGFLVWVLLIPHAGAQVTALRTGDLVLANYRAADGLVVRVDPLSGSVRRLGTFSVPTDVALAPDGFLYVSELEGTIQRVDLRNGDRALVNPGSALSELWGMTLGPGGFLFVTTGISNQVVRVDPQTGEEKVVAQGGELSLPTGIDVLDADHLVVASRANNRVVAISLTNASQTVLAQGSDGIDQPWGVAVVDGSVYVGAHDSRLLFRISGAVITNVLAPSAPKLGGNPYGMGSDLEGRIVIGTSGGVAGPYELEVRDALGAPGPTYSGDRIGEVTGLEVARATVLAAVQTNSAPELPQLPDQSTDEGVALAMAVMGADRDWPLQDLHYRLIGEVPAGAVLSETGLFVWKPSEAQGPASHVFTVVAADDGVPSLTATQAFTVVVREVNAAPALTNPGDQIAVLGVPLSVQVEAADPDLPEQPLGFSLTPGAPAGATVTAGGLFQWTPPPSGGPGMYEIGVTVTDTADPPLSATAYFVVTVVEPNTPPRTSAVTNQVVDEGTLLSLQILATDTDVPAQHLVFGASGSWPVGAVISETGAFTWTPGEAQGPATHTLAFWVMDDGVPPLATTNTINVIVREVNRTPEVDPLPDLETIPGATLTFHVTARDPDLPAQGLGLYLAPGAPAGITLNAAGDGRWEIPTNQAAGVYLVSVVVVDDGTPALTNEVSFSVTVRGGFTLSPGDVIVANYSENTVVRVVPRTGEIQLLARATNPTDVALDADGHLYVSEQAGTIKRLDLLTGVISVVNSNTALSDVRAITVGPWGFLYAACAGDDSVVAIDPVSGQELPLTRGELLSGPYGIAVLDQDHLVVTSLYNDRLVELTLTNLAQRVIAEGGDIHEPWGVAASGYTVVFVSSATGSVQTVAGGVVTQLAPTDTHPCGIGIGTDGSLAFSESDGLVSSLVSLDAAGQPGSGPAIELPGFCMGVEVVPGTAPAPVPTLEWSERVEGPFVDETGVSVDTGTHELQAPLRGAACFYRLVSSAATRIRGVRTAQTHVIVSYE